MASETLVRKKTFQLRPEDAEKLISITCHYPRRVPRVDPERVEEGPSLGAKEV